VQGNVSRTEVMLDISELIFFIYNVNSHKKERKYSADTSLQERRKEKNMVKWL
jgi:hypothetical protein